MAKSRNLMIVESHSKCSNIANYLKIIDPDNLWEVKASMGHVDDLNTDKDGKFGSLGVNTKTLETDYKLSMRGSEIIKNLKKLIKKNNYQRIILATDPDREGEAIAEHLRRRLGLGENYERITFNEVTLQGVQHGFQNPRKISKSLINAQESRRIMDRLVGWRGTSVVSQALQEQAPIGRVVSPAVKMIVDVERQRKNFIPKDYYGVKIDLPDNWKASLDVVNSLLAEKPSEFQDLEKAKEIVELFKNGKTVTVIDFSEKEKKEFAPQAFRTSTLQSIASSKLGWKAKKCDEIAQTLYQKGYITYPRTDSTTISDVAFKALTEYANEKGLPILSERRKGRSPKVAQEAHECIRPTVFDFDGTGLEDDEKLLYDLIWKRTVASQLMPALYDVRSVVLSDDDDELIFKASGRKLKYKGWLAVMPEVAEDEDEDDGEIGIPVLENGTVLIAEGAELTSGQTKPPARYSQHTLGKALESLGIGRPSTYASIYEKITERGHGYVAEEGKYYVPNPLAEKMVELTEDELKIMDLAFSESMEEYLDKIANGDADHRGYLFDFFDLLDENLKRIASKRKIEKKVCFKCGQKSLILIPRKNKNSFWGCQNKDCRKAFDNVDGEPVTREQRWCYADGSPKFACPKCKNFMYRVEGKKKKNTFWWLCSNNKNGCNTIMADKKGKPDIAALKSRQEWLQAVKDAHNEDGQPIYPCPDCGKALVRRPTAKGGWYWRCCALKKECGYFTFDDNGKPKNK